MLCFLLILTASATTAVFATSSARISTSTTLSLGSQSRLKNITTLGLAFPGGISMTSQQVGWALASNGLQRTSDGGQTWQTVARSTPHAGLRPVYVLDGQTAWYVTTNNQTFTTIALYRTNDGGQTWTRFNWISPTQFLVAISLPDQQHALVSTVDTSSVQPVFHLYLVGESGQGFQEVTLPGQNPVVNLYFLSLQVGWAAEQTPDGSSENLFMTRDGGQNWTEQTLALPAGVPATDTVALNFLGFGNQETGYLTAMFNNPTTQAVDATQIYATSDGGQSWQPYGASEPANVQLVAQIDPWHVTTSTPIFISPGGEEELGTLLSGAWTVQSIGLPNVAQPDINGSWLTVFTNQVMFVSSFNADNSAQIVYRTQDGGVTWQQIASVPFSI